MKIMFFQNNNILKFQKQNLTFRANLTPKMFREIQRTNTLEISTKLAKKSIPTDFQGNKVIAWSCYRIVEIFEQLERRFGQKLFLPKGIYVEDFKDLNVEGSYVLGTCNLRLSELRKNSTVAVPSRTLFFNSVHNWDNINSISDNQYAARHFSTDHFLYAFLHEFAHASHEDRLLNKMGGKKLAKVLETLSESEQLQKYRDTYGQSVRQICDYAENSPLDAVACDIPKRIVDVLDNETLLPTKNPFVDTPYKKLYFWEKTPIDTNPLNKILRNFWDGKFD